MTHLGGAAAIMAAMKRKILRSIIPGVALFTLIVGCYALIRPIRWRMDVLDTSQKTVTLLLEGDTAALGITGTVYYVEGAPEGGDEWQINDRVLKAAYERSDGGCQVARPGLGVREFDGFQRLSLQSPQWVVLTVAAFVFVLPIVFRRRRRKGAAIGAAGDDQSNESGDEAHDSGPSARPPTAVEREG